MGRRCDVCGIYLSPAVWLQHENGKKHKKLLHQLHVKNAKRSRVVSNLPSGMNETQLQGRLKSFLGIEHIEIKGTSAVLKFENEHFAKTFASVKHFIALKELVVRRLFIPIPTPESQNQQENPLDIDPGTRDQLLSQDSVDSQMHVLTEHFSIKEDTVRQRLGICQMLQAVMRDFFPDCVVIPYGSCANGLGMTDSDLDLFIDLKVEFDHLDSTNGMKMVSTLIRCLDAYKCQSRGFENDRFLKNVRSLNSRVVIHIVKKIIGQYIRECADVYCIPHARCPIVTFVHRPTQSCCDVSVHNGLAVHNTVLVRFFQKLDPRVRPLLFTIRYWAKRMQLVDSKKNRFSSYAITMLTVFYLQNCNPTVLPSVETLQQLTDSNAMCYDWKCHFCMEEEKIPKTANKDPLEVLLAGFFNYYTEVDLAVKVLSLRTARVMSPPQFQEYLNGNENLSDFKMSITNIQDPFELSFNIARGINATGLAQWNSAVSQARSICSSGALWEKITTNQAWGLVCLLSVDPNPAACPKSKSGKRKRASEFLAEPLVRAKNKKKKKKKKAAVLGHATDSQGPARKKRRTT